MAKKLRTLQEIDRDELALEPPKMTVLSDRPLRADESHRDGLDLRVKLGPIFDILRHPDTRTPLAIAIYGDWGTGKTSAMKWLEGMLRIWNKQGDRDRGKAVRPVWFYPWKYHTKDDVWRGLIAEVILASIQARELSGGRIKKAAKQFGRFLGRTFLHVLSGLRISGAVTPAIADDIAEEIHKLGNPEAGFLNQFEATLTEWIRDTISNSDERMAIFIDDLDRCMPEVALQVLEALKLYLNIDDLVFVVGVDRVVIDQLIKEHYRKLGLEPNKSKHYLAKMFQVEVVMSPTDVQAVSFLDAQLGAIGAHTNQYWTTELDDGQRQVFRHVVLSQAQRNPRELKRLLNSALIHGAGAKHVSRESFSFAQGMQVYLVRKVLEDRYTMGLSQDTKAGMAFFHQWSQVVRGGAEPTVSNPDERASLLATGGDHLAVETSGFLDAEFAALRRAGGDAVGAVTPYDELLKDPAFTHLRKLLADAELGQLMSIEYPADTSMLADTPRVALADGLIHEAIARQRGKAPLDLTDADFDQVVHLNLAGPELVDISPVQNLHKLQTLDLRNTEVVDVTPLQRLTGLQSLYLAFTPVSDITPLAGLVQLRALSLQGTQVSDIGAVAKMTELNGLNLAETQVRDLTPLAELSGLRTLYLVKTPVTDLRPLHALSGLRMLDVSETQVSDDAVNDLRAALPSLDIRR